MYVEISDILYVGNTLFDGQFKSRQKDIFDRFTERRCSDILFLSRTHAPLRSLPI